MIHVENINVSIGGSRILRGVSLEVPKRGVFCLMGRNGVGKTTVLRSIIGLRHPLEGSIRLHETELLGMTPDARVRAGIGYVPQGRDIFPMLTVEENLMIGAIACGHHPEKNGRLDAVYTLFPVLKDMLRRKGGVLSGGQQQQLAIARALLTEPEFLLLDEPTEGIQPNIIDQIGDAIRQLKETMGILLVEQYLDFAREMADTFAIMDRGAVVASGKVAQLSDELVKEHLTV